MIVDLYEDHTQTYLSRFHSCTLDAARTLQHLDHLLVVNPNPSTTTTDAQAFESSLCCQLKVDVCAIVDAPDSSGANDDSSPRMLLRVWLGDSAPAVYTLWTRSHLASFQSCIAAVAVPFVDYCASHPGLAVDIGGNKKVQQDSNKDDGNNNDDDDDDDDDSSRKSHNRGEARKLLASHLRTVRTAQARLTAPLSAHAQRRRRRRRRRRGDKLDHSDFAAVASDVLQGSMNFAAGCADYGKLLPHVETLLSPQVKGHSVGGGMRTTGAAGLVAPRPAAAPLEKLHRAHVASVGAVLREFFEDVLRDAMVQAPVSSANVDATCPANRQPPELRVAKMLFADILYATKFVVCASRWGSLQLITGRLAVLILMRMVQWSSISTRCCVSFLCFAFSLSSRSPSLFPRGINFRSTNACRAESFRITCMLRFVFLICVTYFGLL